MTRHRARDRHSRSRARRPPRSATRGPYEKIAGRLRFAVDPAHPQHRAITDLELAPGGTRAGRVEFSRRTSISLQPADPAQGGRLLLVDVPNRGRKVALGMFNSTPARRRSHHRGRFRQRLPHALGLHGGLGGMAAGRAAPGRASWRWTRRGRSGRGGARHRPASLPVAAERPRGHPAARGPVSHPVSRRLARGRGSGAERARARGAHRAWPSRARRGGFARRGADGRVIAGRLAPASLRRLRAGPDLRAHLPLSGSDAGRVSVCLRCAMWARGCASARRGGKSLRGSARPPLCLRCLPDGALPQLSSSPAASRCSAATSRRSDQAEERTRFSALLDRLGIPSPRAAWPTASTRRSRSPSGSATRSSSGRSFVIGGLAIDFCYSPEDLVRQLAAATVVDPDRPVRIDRYLEASRSTSTRSATASGS